MDSPTSRARTPLERFLTLFADVQAGEGARVLLLALNIFLIFTAYYIIKPVREALILSVDDGARLKSFASAGQALLLLGAVPLYGRLASRFPRRRLINVVTVFFAANLAVFYLLIKTLGQGGVTLGFGFFLWVGVFNLMVPAQFWSFANDVYTTEQGKRLFAIVAFGASLGAVLGSRLTDMLILPLGLDQLLLMSGGLLLVALAITNVVDAQATRESAAEHGEKAAEAEKPLAAGDGFAMVLRSRYLLLIGLLLLLLNGVNTTGEYILGDTVKASIEQQAQEAQIDEAQRDEWVGERIGAFYANFFYYVNIAGVLIQLFLVSRILKYLGVRIALMILPVIALGGYALLAFFPVLSVVRWAKTAENSTDYSLNNTVRQALFLPTTREEKYKAKQAIDTFFVRTGDLFSLGVVVLGTSVLGLSTKGFALVNLGLVAVWLVIALQIGREYRKRVETE